MTCKGIFNRKTRLEKAKGASRKACANFYFMKPLYHIDRGKSDIVPHFIRRMKAITYAKKLMLRVLTSFRTDAHRCSPCHAERSGIVRRTIPRSRSVSTRPPPRRGARIFTFRRPALCPTHSHSSNLHAPRYPQTAPRGWPWSAQARSQD